MHTFWIIIQLFVSFSLWFPLILFCIAALSKATKKKGADLDFSSDFGVIVTAYQQVDFIEDVVNSILKNRYPHYLIYVVADACDVSTLNFSSDRVVVLRPENNLSSNAKSHFFAINHFKREHNVITIIDSDNLIDEDYLEKMDLVFRKGFKAVQGVRKARNLETVYARLDEAGDIYYRFVDRKLLFDAGSSASLAGSGMGFLTETFVSCLAGFDKTGAGFDKFLQYELLNRNYRIAFDEDVVVYDGKTSKSDQLVKQRARWINTWFKYWVLGITLFVKSILGLNWNQFAFSVMLLRPPLFLLFSSAGIIMALDLIFTPSLLWIWASAFLIFFFMFFIALQYFKADKRIYKSLMQTPKFVFCQIKALFRAGAANKLSVATRHELPSYNKK